MPRDRSGCCVLCPGRPPERRSFLDAILVAGTLIDQGCPPDLLPELVATHDAERFVRAESRDVRFALARGLLLRRMAAVIA